MNAKIIGIVLAMLTVVSGAFAFTPIVGGEEGITVETEDFVPLIWLHKYGCSAWHNNADMQEGEFFLTERVEDYAFTGERIICDVLVMDKNGFEKIMDVYMGVSSSGQDPMDFDIESNCNVKEQFVDPNDYNARIGEELIEEFDTATMRGYACVFTVEPGHEGEYWLTVLVEDLDNQLNSIDENQYWFFNPIVAITVSGDIDFGIVRPGTNSYTDTLLIENTAEAGSGVLLDMAISGTDFYDPASSGAKCPYSNLLELRNLAYYASNGAYHTVPGNARVNTVGQGGNDEGYYGIPYEVADPDARAPIIEGMGLVGALSFFPPGLEFAPAGNVLSPGAEIALTFRLALPEPCNGDFSDGALYFWGTAI